jgi:hypothetical protein
MRIVILGDFHLSPEQYELTESAMADIVQSKPDLVIPLGDFGSRMLIGSTEGLEEAKRFLDQTGTTLRPILGNHDLERESGPGLQPKGTMIDYFQSLFELEQPYGVLEYEHFRLFFASTDPQSPDSCYDVQECFVSDIQFNYLTRKLKERPNVPVIFFTHAPPIGCGLRTVPRVHVRSTNAYLDQNHDPLRWYHLFRNTPEIVMWFSAHYHLSHIHPDASTLRFGTRFFITGVHGMCTRDGNRQSRILDIGSTGVKVSTLDHIQRTITDEGGWSYEGELGGLVQVPTVKLSLTASTSVGEAAAVPYGIVPISAKRYIVSTEDGFSWETEPVVEAVMGTYHIGPALKGIAVSRDNVWIAWDQYVGRSDLRNPWRFVRLEHGPWPTNKLALDNTIQSIAANVSGGIWVLAGSELFKVDYSEITADFQFERIMAVDEPCETLIPSDGHVWILASSGVLYDYNEADQTLLKHREHVLAWDSGCGQHVGLVSHNGQLAIISEDGEHSIRFVLPDAFNHTPPETVRILALGRHHAAVQIDGSVYYAVINGQTLTKLDTVGSTVTDIAKCLEEDVAATCSSFALAVHPGEGRPQLQIWQCTLE